LQFVKPLHARTKIHLPVFCPPITTAKRTPKHHLPSLSHNFGQRKPKKILQIFLAAALQLFRARLDLDGLLRHARAKEVKHVSKII
jgi:hypothetical protein